jgi:hypothetical protein
VLVSQRCDACSYVRGSAGEDRSAERAGGRRQITDFRSHLVRHGLLSGTLRVVALDPRSRPHPVSRGPCVGPRNPCPRKSLAEETFRLSPGWLTISALYSTTSSTAGTRRRVIVSGCRWRLSVRSHRALDGLSDLCDDARRLVAKSKGR